MSAGYARDTTAPAVEHRRVPASKPLVAPLAPPNRRAQQERFVCALGFSPLGPVAIRLQTRFLHRDADVGLARIAERYGRARFTSLFSSDEQSIERLSAAGASGSFLGGPVFERAD